MTANLLDLETIGFPGYSVSDDGRVFSCIPWRGTNSRELKHEITRLGYHRVALKKNNFMMRMLVHRLVAIMFVENPNGYDEVRHLDDNKDNNHVTNLAWGTHSDNIMDAVRLGNWGKN